MMCLYGYIDDFIEVLKKFKEEGYEIIVVSNIISGTLLAPSKKRKLFRIPMAVPSDIFKEESVHLFIGKDRPTLPLLLVLVHDQNILQEEVINNIKKNRITVKDEE